MSEIEVYDPALCCSTGVCGPSVDPSLAQFAADLERLAATGVTVNRFGLASEPGRFVAQAEVATLLQDHWPS